MTSPDDPVTEDDDRAAQAAADALREAKGSMYRERICEAARRSKLPPAAP
jgi:hypothetical protein